MGEQKPFFTAKTHTCRDVAVPGKDAKFSLMLRVLRAFAVRLQTILTIKTQEGDYQSVEFAESVLTNFG
jgi:hypothetical protein